MFALANLWTCIATTNMTKKIFFLISVLIIFILVGCSLRCEPEIMKFNFDFRQNNEILKYDIVGNNNEFDFWLNGNKYSDKDIKEILLYVPEGSEYFDVFIDVDYALCDPNDSYTKVDESKIKLIIMDKKYDFVDNFKYRIHKENFDKDIKISLDYNGTFHTERIIKVMVKDIGIDSQT